MPVLSKVKDFFVRHKNKFIASAVVIGGSVLLTRYAQRKLRDWQERETRDFIERTRKQQHFENTERTCNETILSLKHALIEALNKSLDTEEILTKLRNNQGNKIELWNELKLAVFTKLTTLVYASVMLVVTLRVQLNVLGGYMFKDAGEVSAEAQQKYLNMCDRLLSEGVEKLTGFIRKEFVQMIEPIGLNKSMQLKDFEAIFWTIQTRIATHQLNPFEHFTDYLIETEVNTSLNDIYTKMVRDTADLLESDEIKSLTAHCVNRGFALISDELAEYFSKSASSNNNKENGLGLDNHVMTNGFVNLIDKHIVLAKLIPIMNGMCFKNCLPSKLFQMLIANDKVKTFGANVYECFSCG